MPREERDEVIGQTGVPRSCCGSGPPRPINQSGGHAQMSSGLESSADFQEEAGYTYASVAVPQSLNYALTPRAGPYTAHMRFVHSCCGFELLLSGYALDRRCDLRCLIEPGEFVLPWAILLHMPLDVLYQVAEAFPCVI